MAGSVSQTRANCGDGWGKEKVQLVPWRDLPRSHSWDVSTGHVKRLLGSTEDLCAHVGPCVSVQLSPGPRAYPRLAAD